MHFATNHFAHFALATGLHRALAAADGTRVVSVGAYALDPEAAGFSVGSCIGQIRASGEKW